MIGPLPLRDRMAPWWQLAVMAALLVAAPTVGVVAAQAVAGTHSAQRPVLPQAAPMCVAGGRY